MRRTTKSGSVWAVVHIRQNTVVGLFNNRRRAESSIKNFTRRLAIQRISATHGKIAAELVVCLSHGIKMDQEDFLDAISCFDHLSKKVEYILHTRMSLKNAAHKIINLYIEDTKTIRKRHWQPLHKDWDNIYKLVKMPINENVVGGAWA